MWSLVSESSAGTWCPQADGWEGRMVVEWGKKRPNWNLQVWAGTLKNELEPVWVPYCLQVSNFDDEGFLQEKLVPLCHIAKHTSGPGVGELRAGDAVGSGGVKHLAADTLQPRSQGVSTTRQELQQCLVLHQPSQHQKLAENWSHEGNVDSGKCSPSLAKLTQHKSPTITGNAYGRND